MALLLQYSQLSNCCGKEIASYRQYNMQHSTSQQLQNPQQISPATSLSELLPPANLIITKNISQTEQRVSIKMQAIPTDNSIHFSTLHTSHPYSQPYSTPSPQIKRIKRQTDDQTSFMQDEYDNSNLIYRRYDNSECNRRDKSDKVQYISGVFAKKNHQGKIQFPPSIGNIKDDQLQFDSNYEGGNLMLVYKKSSNAYDLILQNDTNTGGCTQWFNFKVKNKRHNFVARFNIVNLYKSDSLYNYGMKPCVRSMRSDKQGRKMWRRKGFNISYTINDLNYEDNPKKYYKTLSFQYDFTIQNDTVQFAHSMPYDLEDLNTLLESVKNNQKVSIHTIGNTYMGRPIPAVRIKSLQQANNVEKKAIIIMGRQHPGQTMGSHIGEQMLQEMLRNSDQTQFLVWRYDVYFIPMVNIDGVAVGNYRSNFAGFDLNRCWERSDPKLHPQAFAIKSFIRKISKKQHIELILDLHGHSRKMGSFFYGNNTGKNPMLFPYIASKSNPHILFQESRFSTERGSKAETARVALGKIIKSTGNVYTYEVSFYGHYKQEKSNPFSFTDVHYRDLGKAMVQAMYRTYMEMYKQEKNLKQSVFLKNMKKQIQQLKESVTVKDQDDSGSDSEAQQLMNEERQKLKEFYSKQNEQKMESEQVVSQSVAIFNKQIKKQNERQYKRQMKPISQLLGSGRAREYFEVRNIIKSRFPQLNRSEIIQTEQQLERQLQHKAQQQESNNRKAQTHRLKIYGQTYALKSRIGLQADSNQSPRKGQKSNKAMKTIQMKKKPKKMKQYEKETLLRSYNTVDYNLPRQMRSKDIQIHRGKQKNKSRSLTMKQVTPVFHDHLTSESARTQGQDPLLKNERKKTNFMIEYLGKQIRLPLI